VAQAPLIRKGFVMQVDPKRHDEYKRRHDELWPDLRAVRQHCNCLFQIRSLRMMGAVSPTRRFCRLRVLILQPHLHACAGA
jgi:hypothetical protein